VIRDDPDFFRRLAAQQAPKYLWIGCSDASTHAAPFVIGAAALLLLLVGIHNSWDAITYHALSRGKDSKREK
jgi:hypothetical protein